MDYGDGEISGVVHGGGAPIAGARVSLRTATGTRVTVSDPAGRFRFFRVPAGASVLIEADGWTTGRVEDVEFRTRRVELDVTLEAR